MARNSSGGKFNKVKYEEMLLNEVNLKLRREFKDPRLTLVTVTRVELNQDYSAAKLYWDTYNAKTRGDAMSAMKNLAGPMRSKLAQSLNVRHIPELSFIYDSQFEDEKKISDLLKETSDGEE